MYGVWWLITVVAGYKFLTGANVPDGFVEFYITFSSAVTIMISFYYKGKREDVEAD